MKETDLQNAFEFGTLLMNKLTALKEHEYRCISCDFTGSEKSSYTFYFEFSSSKLKNKIKFYYCPASQSKSCLFDVDIESENGDHIDFKKIVNSSKLHKINLFYCDTYPGDFPDKVNGFVEKIDSLLKNYFTGD